MNTTELRNATAVVGKEYRAGILTHREYRARITVLENRWREWLRQQYLPGYTKKVASAVFERAWEAGHSEGYEYVAALYEDLADFVAIIRVEVLK